MGKVRAWSGETGDGSYWRRGKEAKAKCSIAQYEVQRDNKNVYWLSPILVT
jgi:hypothetical protein